MNICATISSAALAIAAVSAGTLTQTTPTGKENRNNMEELKLTGEWDKTFPKSDKVIHRKAAFKNRYGITLAADVYAPKEAKGKLPAIAVCGPFGAVKEQSSGLYAQTMAERGFLAIAFDPSYTGESGGFPALCGVSRHQHRGFLRRSRFPLQPRRRRPRAHRDYRNLRMGRHGAQRGGHRHAHQGDRHIHHVRHEPRHRKRLLRLNGRRQARRAPQTAQRPENRRLQKRLV